MADFVKAPHTSRLPVTAPKTKKKSGGAPNFAEIQRQIEAEWDEPMEMPTYSPVMANRAAANLLGSLAQQATLSDQTSTDPAAESAAANPQIQASPINSPTDQPGCADCAEEQSVDEKKATVQPKLAIGQAGDPYEQEADQVAQQVVNSLHAPQSPPVSSEATPVAKPQRLPGQSAVADVAVMGQGGEGTTEVSEDVVARIQRSRGRGRPLGESVQGPMEQAFGADFGGVRIHTDGESHKLNQAIQAKAFTTGQDIYFRGGAYEPGSRGGQELLAHELTHVVQQAGDIRAKGKPNKEQIKLARSPLPGLTAFNYLQKRLDQDTSRETASQPERDEPRGDELSITEAISPQDREITSRTSGAKGAGSSGGSGVAGVRGMAASNNGAAPIGETSATPATPEEDSGVAGVASALGGVATEEQTHNPAGSEAAVGVVDDAVPSAEGVDRGNSSATTGESAPATGATENVSNPEVAKPGGPSPATAVSGESVGGVGGTEASGVASHQATVSLSTEDPGQIIEQLTITPPTQLPATYAQAGSASAQALESQRRQLQDSLPEMPAPTGLSATAVTEAKPGQAAQQTAEQAANSGKEPAITLEGSGAGAVSAAEQIQVPEAPAALPQAPTQLAGGEGQTEGESDTILSQSAQRALSSINANTSQISTRFGERPQVELAGDADPSQMETAKAASIQEVQSAKVNAAQAINQDFGENDIYPQASDEILKSNKELAAITPGAAQAKEAATGVPGEVAGSLDQSLAPYLREQIGTEQEKYRAGKEKFDTDTTQARAKADEDIAALNEETQQEQLKEQQTAEAEVAQAKQEWRDELDAVEQDYQDKASKATTDQRKKIDEEKAKGDSEAAKHIEEAEQKAEAEKQKADQEATKKKEEGKKESGGFWGWVKSKAKAFIDGIKAAVNFIYDNLRKAVKVIFEAAKKLAVAAIELARIAITTLIKGLGEVLKGLVKVVFAAFPEIAKRINAKIDQAVNKAVDLVNKAADLLKKGVTALLDFLANAIDTILAAYQAIYNAVFDAIGAVVEALIGVLEKIGNLVSAAQQMPDHFWGQMSEEVLGMDVTQPLPFERTAEDCAQCSAPATLEGTSLAAEGGNSALAQMLSKDEFTEDDIAVDQVASFTPEPEFLASLNLQDGGEVEFGESNDPAASIEAIKAELAGEVNPEGEAAESETETMSAEVAGGEAAPAGACCDDEATAQAKLEQMMAQKVEGAESTQKQGEPAKQGDIPANMRTLGPLTPGQRASYMFNQLKQGVKQWFAANWGKLLAGAIAGITGFIAANILTGGAVMAAVPPLLQILGAVMAGVALAQIAGHVGSYATKGWAGDIGGAAQSLARAVAVGAVELVFALLFSAGAVVKALKGGVKGATKAAVTSVKTAVKTTAKSAKELAKIGAKGAETAFKNGKLLFKGVNSGFSKGVKSIDDLSKRLKDRLGFNKFKITFGNRELALWGHINPWKKLASTILDSDVEFLSNQTGRKPNEIRDILNKPSHRRSLADEEFLADALKQVKENNVQLLANQTGRSVDEINKILDNAESFRSADETFILDALNTVKTGGVLDQQKIQHLDDVFRRVGADLRSPVHGATVSKTGRFIQFTENSIEHVGIRHVPEMFDPQASLHSLNNQGIVNPTHVTNFFPPNTFSGDRALTTLLRQSIEKTRAAEKVFNIKIRGQNVRVVTGGAPGGTGHQVVSIFPTNGAGVTRAQIETWANEVTSGVKTLEQVRSELRALLT